MDGNATFWLLTTLSVIGVYFIVNRYAPAVQTDSDFIIATVTKVVDGDSFKVQTDEAERSIRLIGYDAPELKQVGGEQAKQHLASLLTKKVWIERNLKNMHKGRQISQVWTTNDVNISYQMVYDGWGIVNPKYDIEIFNKSLLNDVQTYAQQQHRGYWSNQIAPQDRENPWETRMRGIRQKVRST